MCAAHLNGSGTNWMFSLLCRVLVVVVDDWSAAMFLDLCETNLSRYVTVNSSDEQKRKGGKERTVYLEKEKCISLYYSVDEKLILDDISNSQWELFFSRDLYLLYTASTYARI